MSDSNKMLPTGSGGVFVTVADVNNNPIIDPISQQPIGELVTSFRYDYDEEDDDTCTITIQCQNPNLVDIPNFREQQYLLVQWGLLYSNGTMFPSPPRKVMIRDITLNGNADVNVSIVLECTDGFSINKTKKNNKRKDDEFIDWIKGNLGSNYKMKFQILDAKPSDTKSNAFTDWENEYRCIVNTPSEQPKYGSYGVKPRTINYNNTQPPEVGLRDTEPETLLKRRLTIQTGKTPFTSLKDALKTVEGGPYHLDTRDDGFSIHPTNFNQPSIGTFTWKAEGSEIISFSISTRKKPIAIDAVGKSGIDGKTKNINTSVTQSNSAVPDLNVDGITGAAIPIDKYADTETTKQALSKNQDLLKAYATDYLNQTIQLYNQANNDPLILSTIGLEPMVVKVKAKVREKVKSRDYDPGPGISGLGNSKDHRGWNTLKRDKDVIIVSPLPNDPYSSLDPSSPNNWRSPEIIIEKEIPVELQPADLLGYAGSVSNSTVMALNKLNDALQKQIECDLRVIGQPFLESGKIITLKNISNKYSGDWYIKSIEHRIDMNSGYTCNVNLIKKTASNGDIVQSTVNKGISAMNAKIQEIAQAQLDPVQAAKNAEIKSLQQFILNKFEDAGDLIIITDDEGRPTKVFADNDWVSLEKITQTENINNTDDSLRQITQ